MTSTGGAGDALWVTVPRLLAGLTYCVLATADEQGTPWATPVFFAARDDRELFWVSSAAGRHSRNIAVRPAIAVTVFDSTVAVGAAEALYLEADAAAYDGTDAALAVLNGRLPPHQGLTPDDPAPTGPLTVYRAVITRYDVLVRGGDPSFDNVVDQRYEVRAPRS